jgi:uncharacterized membrane protein affecting hemolysin expression
LFDDRRRWKADDKVMMMMVMMVMIMVGNFWSQSTDDGFAENILESSDVLIKRKSLSLSQVISWSCSDYNLLGSSLLCFFFIN